MSSASECRDSTGGVSRVCERQIHPLELPDHAGNFTRLVNIHHGYNIADHDQPMRVGRPYGAVENMSPTRRVVQCRSSQSGRGQHNATRLYWNVAAMSSITRVYISTTIKRIILCVPFLTVAINTRHVMELLSHELQDIRQVSTLLAGSGPISIPSLPKYPIT